MAQLSCALGPDCAGTLLARFVRSARQRLDVATYQIGPYWTPLLHGAARRGVRVRLLIDIPKNSDGGLALLREMEARDHVKVACRSLTPAGSHMHWKLLIADSDALAVGTGNLDARDAPRDPHDLLPPDSRPLAGTREWWALASGVPTLAARARGVFADAWTSAASPVVWPVGAEVAPPVNAPAHAVAPLELETAARRLALCSGGAAIAAQLLADIERARQRVWIIIPYVHTASPRVSSLLDALDSAVTRGVDVRLLLGGQPPSDSDAAALRQREAQVRVLTITEGHAKGVITDAVTHVCSANWSEEGLGRGMETALRLDEPAATQWYADAHARDWESAEPLR